MGFERSNYGNTTRKLIPGLEKTAEATGTVIE